MFDKRGFYKGKKIISTKDLKNLNQELDNLFAAPTINFSYGHIRVNKSLKLIPFPFSWIRNFDCLELAKTINNRLKNISQIFLKGEFLLASFNIYEELSDPNELTWHSDFTEDGILAIIYLKGGDEKSGAAQYLPGTHLLTHLHFRPSSLREVEALTVAHGKVNLTGNPGDIVFYRLNGMHSRYPIVNRRRVILASFFKKDGRSLLGNAYKFEDFLLPISRLKNVDYDCLRFLRANNKTKPFSDLDIGTSHFLKRKTFFIFNLTFNFLFNFALTLKNFFGK
jgi:hypothetical protein